MPVAAVGQTAVEVGDHVGQALAGEIVRGARSQARPRPHRGDDHHAILDVVEDRHDRGPHEHGVRNVQGIRVGVRQALHQAHHVVAEEAEQPGGHGRQALGQGDARLFDQAAQLVQRLAGTGLERREVLPGVPIDLRPRAETAPDQVRLQADGRVAAAHGAALDRFQQTAVRAALGELEHGRDRRLQIGDQRGPHHLGLTGLVRCAELGEIGLRRHRVTTARRAAGRPARSASSHPSRSGD